MEAASITPFNKIQLYTKFTQLCSLWFIFFQLVVGWFKTFSFDLYFNDLQQAFLILCKYLSPRLLFSWDVRIFRPVWWFSSFNCTFYSSTTQFFVTTTYPVVPRLRCLITFIMDLVSLTQVSTSSIITLSVQLIFHSFPTSHFENFEWSIFRYFNDLYFAII